MTVEQHQLARSVVDSTTRALRERGIEVPGLTLVEGPHSTARSTLLTLGAAGAGARYVVKIPRAGDGAVDTDAPLSGAVQYEALERAHDWYDAEPVHAVARPVAHLPDLDAVVMEHVAGPSVGRTVRLSVHGPENATTALAAVAAAGDFLRRFHGHAKAPMARLRLGDLVDEVGAAEDTLLRPVRIRLPGEVRRALATVDRTAVHADGVLLHGDFVPDNLIVTGVDQVAMLDPLLLRVGLPEDDAARFLAVLGSDPAFVQGTLRPPVRRLRRRLERSFTSAYLGGPAESAVLELRLLRELVLRWRRRREFSTLAHRPVLMRGRRHVIDAHMRTLLRECADRLTRAGVS